MTDAGRHRIVRPEDLAGLSPDDLEARLLGRPATMGRRDVSRGAEVSLLSARKFWHALGFPIVEDEDAMFTEADLMALKAVARLVRDQELDEATALAMTRAFARTADRLAVWQTQLMADLLEVLGFTPGTRLCWNPDPEGEHNERCWNRRMPAALDFIYP